MGARENLDAFFDSCFGAYSVPGSSQPVRVPVHFRMMGGLRQPDVDAARDLIEDLLGVDSAATADSWRIDRIVNGRGTPPEIAQVTQALIDRGQLGGADTAYESVRQLMWRFGIGLDCAGYVAQAVPAGLALPASSLGIADAIDKEWGLHFKAPYFQSVPVESAAAGDAMVLLYLSATGSCQPPAPGDEDYGEPGHKVVIRDVRPFITGTGPPPAADDFFARDVKVFELDSSWGASGDWTNPRGGVMRRTWLYNAAGDWADFTGGTFSRFKCGPYDHQIDGIYRHRT